MNNFAGREHRDKLRIFGWEDSQEFIALIISDKCIVICPSILNILINKGVL